MEFRERIENILKIRVNEKKEVELRALLREFYKSMIQYIYGNKSTHLLVIDLIKIYSLGFQNAGFY